MKSHGKKCHKFYPVFIFVMLLDSCGGDGKNALQSFEKTNVAVEAAKELENENPSKAIDVILNALGTTYRRLYEEALISSSDLTQLESQINSEMETVIAKGTLDDVPNLVSILSSAQAQLLGADPFNIALTLAKNSENEENGNSDSSSSEINTLALLFPILPESTDSNIRGLEVAIMLINSIGSRISEVDDFKKAIFLTANISLITKGLDTDGNGSISAVESINLSESVARNLLSSIANAVSSASATGNSDNSRSATSAKMITSLQEQIDASDGENSSDRLRDFISQE